MTAERPPLSVIALVFATAAVAYATEVATLVLGWRWFIEALGLPPLSVPHAAALMLLTRIVVRNDMTLVMKSLERIEDQLHVQPARGSTSWFAALRRLAFELLLGRAFAVAILWTIHEATT